MRFRYYTSFGSDLHSYIDLWRALLDYIYIRWYIPCTTARRRRVTTPTTKKKPRGARIPRLQEISYLTVAMLGVADGANFEEIRQRLIDHMIEMRENSDATVNTATFRTAKNDPKRYVTNASQSLKELMGIGLVEKATVPSSARAALNYATTTFLPTPKGKRVGPTPAR